MFAHLLGHQGYFGEMNVLDNQWMSRVTWDASLRQAVDRVTGPAIHDAIGLTWTMMRQAGIEGPRIAVAALNPHGGENGLFGSEEIEIIRPAVEAMAGQEIGCEGPFLPIPSISRHSPASMTAWSQCIMTRGRSRPS